MTFADRLRALMRERDIGTTAVARRVPCDAALISRLAHGRQLPSARTAQRLDEILGAGGQLAAAADDKPLGGLDPDWGPLDVLPDAGQVRENSQMLVRLESRLGGDDVVPAAIRAFGAARTAITTRARTEAERRDIRAAAGEAGEVAAWVSYDADDLRLSRRLAAAALPLSREAGDADMAMFLENHLAMLDLGSGNPGRALRTSDTVLASGRLAPRVRAVFHVRRGRALAQLGDRTRAMSALATAADIVAAGKSPRDPWWTWWLDASEVEWHRAVAATEAGDVRAAVSGFEHALELRPTARVRARFNDAAWLLDAYSRAGAWSEAAPLARKVAEAGRGVTSGRTRNLLRATVRRMIASGSPEAAGAAREL